MKEPAPLPDDLLDFIAAERDGEVPAPAARERMFARLAPLLIVPPIGGGGGGTTGGSPPGTGSTGSTTGGAPGAGSAATGGLAGSALKGKVLIALFSAAIGAGAGAAAHAKLASPRVEPVAIVASAAPSSVVVEAIAPTVEPTAVASAEVQPTPSASARADDHAKNAGSLRAERLLLEAATSALVRGDSASAIASLQKHARTFPRGELAQEREVLMVQALKASGDQGAADQRAKDFKKKFPGSLQQQTVDQASRPQ